ncbi:unnamed protein product [Symbiodinium sp. CCMP2592]|nr:unnamed protein product [Symbiodinium sp. CCMP2592]
MLFLSFGILLQCTSALRSESRAESYLERLSHHASYTPDEYAKMIEEYEATWSKLGVEVEVFKSIEELVQHQAYHTPWLGPADKKVSWGSSKDTSSCKDDLCFAVGIEHVVPYFAETEAILYHGGNLKAQEFADGIKFGMGLDQISGPTFFATHNLFLALYYGGKGLLSWGDWSDASSKEFYRMALEIKVQNPSQCAGIVPNWKFLTEMATKFNSSLESMIQQPCGRERCSFVAVNWNKEDQEGSALIPYEFRMLPGSVETCGLKLSKVIMVHTDVDDKMFNDFEGSESWMASGQTFKELLMRNIEARKLAARSNSSQVA